MASTNQIELDLRVMARSFGNPPIGGGHILFPGESRQNFPDVPNMIAQRFTRDNLQISDDNLVFFLIKSGGVVNAGGVPAINPAGDPVLEIADPFLIYIKTPLACTVTPLGSPTAPSILPDAIRAGAALLVTADDAPVGEDPIAGFSLTFLGEDVDALEATTGFYLDVIYAARGA